MFSATLSKDVRPVCKKFMQDVSLNLELKKYFGIDLLILPNWRFL